MSRWHVERSPDAIYSFSSDCAWLPHPNPGTRWLVTTRDFTDLIV